MDDQDSGVSFSSSTGTCATFMSRVLWFVNGNAMLVMILTVSRQFEHTHTSKFVIQKMCHVQSLRSAVSKCVGRTCAEHSTPQRRCQQPRPPLLVHHPAQPSPPPQLLCVACLHVTKQGQIS